MAEFALVFPILLVILLGVFDVGRGVFIYTSVTNGAREGARLAIVNQSVPLITERALSQTAVAVTASSTVTATFWEPGTNGNPTATPCAPDEDAVASAGCVVVVTYATTFRPITPVISQIVWPHGITVTAESIETVEYACPNATITVATSCPRQP